MSLVELTLACGLGTAGALLHLLSTALRARLAARGRLLASLLLFPVGLLGPAATVLGASWASARLAWLTAAALVVAHWLAVWRLRRRLTSNLEHRDTPGVSV